MLNMSKEFYRYLSNQLVKFLEKRMIKCGERFYIQLDEENQVEEFLNVLKEDENSHEFKYKHDQGSEYKTFFIEINGVKLVVASTKDVTSGYLVTIRNASREQQGEWENTALLILCCKPLDSIKGGCCDLRKDGMPFSVKYISNNLEDIIENSKLSKIDKEILKFYTSKKMSDYYNSSLWDYEEILSVVNKGRVEECDYQNMGLFIDKSLNSYNKKSIQKRLKDNSNLFSRVETCHQYEDKVQQLEKFFDDKGVDILKKESWREVDFTLAKESSENNMKDKPLGYLESNDKHITEEIVFWERPKSDTASGKRKRHIIVFNKGNTENVVLTFNFDDTLSKEFINNKSKEFMSVSGKKMKIELPVDPYESKFYKLIYENENKSKSKYEFFIAIVNIEESLIKNIKTNYEITAGSGSKNRIRIINNGSEIKFGCGKDCDEVDVNVTDETIHIEETDCIRISNSSAAWSDDSLRFILESNTGKIPVEIKENNLMSTPIKSLSILKQKREFKESFIQEQNKIIRGTSEFYLEEKLKQFLNKEKEIIEKGIFYGIQDINGITSKKVEFSDELINAYNDIIEYYRRIESIPSLCYLNDEIRDLYEKYIKIYNKEIEDIEEREIISNNKLKKDLLKLGTIETESQILFSPLSPINIAYILELYNQLDDEVIENHILTRLNANNLLPYIYNDDNEVYKPIYQKDNVEWIVFEKKEKVSVGVTNAYVARVVSEKLQQFISNFNYLFSKNYKSPIKINIINIKNDNEVVKGVFEFIKGQILKNINNIIPVEIRIYNEEGVSEFDRFFKISSIEKIEEEFNISFSSKNNEIDEIDVMRIAFDNIKYFKSKKNDYSYAHISFYKSNDDKNPAEYNTSSMESGISIGGLLSTVTSNNNENDYRIGFGSRHLIKCDNELIRTTLNINEFATNQYNGGINPYRKDTSIVTRPLIMDEDVKQKLYDSSHWVTFIEPSFGLEYFEEADENNLIVIHYSDQYTATEQYDTITVTNKSTQYKYIIQEFLKNKQIKISNKQMNEVIKSFNSINGEWLLNLIANKGEYDREKLSIISALKYGLALLNHEDIIWIPISLEEILRVSNAVRLNKSEGIFSVKNLNKKGIHSDDLIFIGINIKDTHNIKLYYYPVEVKIGYNFANVIDKGTEQIEKTYALIKEQLGKYEKDGRKLFKNKFFRNFFINIFISNSQKFIQNDIWPEKNIERINEFKNLLLNDDYMISFELEKFIGKGALISFKKDNHWRSINKENGVMFVELTEDDAYYGIAKTVNDIVEEINVGKTDILTDDLLCTKDLSIVAETSEKAMRDNIIDVIAEVEQEKMISRINIDKSNDSIRVLLGKLEGSAKKIYWEYGNKELTNRHMVITGKSGNGKTYFLQCALKELADSGVPAVIIDYTDGFKPSQLEKEFKEYLGDRLQQFFVCKDKFPLNPFKRGTKELDDDIYMEEDDVDIAERFKSIIGAVYKDLGVQQLNAIYQSVISGLQKYDGKLNLRAFSNELEELNSSYAQTAHSQLSLLIDKNPFEESKDFNWSNLDTEGGKVFIIQLTGYTKDVQRIITEMILWDLWYYKTQNGSKDKPFAVILDEAQNLNFGDNSPCTKILTEGRKFGWSAWFATQFLKGQMGKSTINRLQNAAQKIYFAQTEEEAVSVANNFADNNEDKKNWTKKLINLEKGSCISYGPIADDDGNILSTQPVKIKITSLNERIK